MPYTISGNTITQTGTDADHSDFLNHPEIGMEFENDGRMRWFIGDRKIVYTGQQTLNPENEEVIGGDNCPAGAIDIDGGDLHIDGLITLNGHTRYSTKTAIYIGNTNGANAFRSFEGSLDVSNGGNLNHEGGVIDAVTGVGSEAGSGGNIRIRGGTIDFSRATGTPPQFRYLNGNVDYIDLTIIGGSATWGNTPIVNASGYTPTHMQEPLVGGGTPSSGFFEVRDYNGLGNTQDGTFLNNNTRTTRLINPVQGSNIFGQGHLGNTTSNRDGNLEIVSEVDYSFTQLGGAPANNLALYVEDVDSGNRLSRVNDYVTDRHISEKFDGSISLSKLIASQVSNNDPTRPIERRTTSQDITDTDDFVVFGYLYNPAVFPQTWTGAGVKNYSNELIFDSLIQEQDEVVALSYTLQDTTAKTYDHLKALRRTTHNGERDTIVTKVLNNLNARDLDVVVDGINTGQATLVDNTLTLHAPIFQGSITTTGVVTRIGGAIVTEGISDANGVALVVNSNAAGGSFTMLNITKFLTNIGYFVDHATAQSANSNPNDGDYYRLDDASEHAYFLDGVWNISQGRDIHEQTTTSSIIGGVGITSSHVVTAIDGHDYRVAVDAFGLYKQVQDVTINGLTSISLNLSTNFNVQASRIADAIPYLTQIATEPPTVDGKIQLKLPQFNLNEGDDADVDLASAVLELATLGEPSQSGAVVTNNAALAEIIDAGILTIQNDTVELLPLDGMTAADITHIPLVINAVNYTIDPTPLNATDGRVTHERVTGNIINTGTIVEPRLDAAVAMLPLVESIFHDTISLDTT